MFEDIQVKVKTKSLDLSNFDEKWLEQEYVSQVTNLLLDKSAKKAKKFASHASNQALITAWEALDKIKGLEDVAHPVKGKQS